MAKDNNVNHTMASRRDARDREELVTQSARANIDMVRPFVRFQTDLMVAWSNWITAWTRMRVIQTEALLEYGEQIGGDEQQ